MPLVYNALRQSQMVGTTTAIEEATPSQHEVAGAVIAIAAGFILTNSHIALDDVLAMGLGSSTVVGILGMLARDTA